MDFERTGKITLQRVCEFNAYLNKNVAKDANISDAKEFMTTCAIIDKQTVSDSSNSGLCGRMAVCIRETQILF